LARKIEKNGEFGYTPEKDHIILPSMRLIDSSSNKTTKVRDDYE